MDSTLLLSPLLTVEQCAERVTAADMAAVEQFSSSARRRERLTWRAMLYDYLGRSVEIAYRDGAPEVVGDTNIYIGVSHTTDLVAVAVSDSLCAVDDERADRDVTRISDRFLTESERKMTTDNRGRVAMWCARECYYKYCRDKSLNILTDIEVAALDFDRGLIVVTDCRGRRLDMNIKQTAEHIVVYRL